MQVDGPPPWTVIVNPASAGGKALKVWDAAVASLREAGVDFRVLRTTQRGDATELTRTAIQEGARRILAVGGDGTNHEVVNGILQQQVVPSSEILYGLWPIGTGNDWIKTYQLPTKTKALVNMIKGEQSQVQDIGWVEFQRRGKREVRFFVNILGMAYDGHVVYEVEQSLARGRKMSRSIYLQATFRSLLRYQTPKTEVQINGQRFRGRHILINAGICRYSGGGMQFVPHADPQNGLLAITVAGDLTALG
ncbi:MAG: diacylglycerol kinase family protein, partial [Bacteroidota bacterium]